MGHPGSKNIVWEMNNTVADLDSATRSVVWISSVSVITSGLRELTVVAHNTQFLASLYRC
jgi:hypothetical protein